LVGYHAWVVYHPKLQNVQIAVQSKGIALDQEREDAIRLCRRLKQGLAGLEKTLSSINPSQRNGKLDLQTRYRQLEQAAMEIAGLGIAPSKQSKHHIGVAHQLAMIRVVQNAASAYKGNSGWGPKPLNPYTTKPRPILDEFPDELVITVRGTLDALLAVSPQLQRKVSPYQDKVVEHLVHATALLVLAKMAAKKRCPYLTSVATAINSAKIVRNCNASSLRTILSRV
jgi:hypothetical protein